MSEARRPRVEGGWQRRPLLSLAIRVAVAAVPLLAGILTCLVISYLIHRPAGGTGYWAWLVGVAAVMLVVILLAGRLARRMLPLAALYNLSLIFPDGAPRRYAVARRAGKPAELLAQLEAARRRGDAGSATYMSDMLELVAALSVHDRQTRGHSERVRVLTDLLADEIGLSAPDRGRLRWASLLHDIGKLTVAATILNKPGKLTEEEFDVIKQHPAEGGAIIEPLREWLGEWGLAVEQHHEAFNGRGYPRGLAGPEISRGGRIVAIADAYEVMTANRPYRKALGAEAARRELVRCAGEQFDPDLVRAFLDISLGRLWRVVGIGAWFAELPLIGVFGSMFAQLGVTGAAAAATVVVGVTVLPPVAQAAPQGAVSILTTSGAAPAPSPVGGRATGQPTRTGATGRPGAATTPTGRSTAAPSSASTSTSAPTSTASSMPSATPSPPPVPTATPTATPAPAPDSLRINGGGSALSACGNSWTADEDYYALNAAGKSDPAVTWVASTTNTPDSSASSKDCAAAVFQTWRGWVPGDSGGYLVSLPNGSYTVRVLEVEETFHAANKRLLTCTLNGVALFTNLDLYAKVGFNHTDWIQHSVTITNGVLKVHISASQGAPIIAGLVVVPNNLTVTSTASADPAS